MKLVRQSTESWQYLLAQNEAFALQALLKKFPFSDFRPSQISRTDSAAPAADREDFLNESLAEHRQELKQHAAGLLAGDRWKKAPTGHVLILDSDSRETLLQILNDIRVGSWHILGQPELIESRSAPKDFGHQQLMDLAGYFEMSLLEPENEQG